jgi:dihydrofolate reductase
MIRHIVAVDKDNGIARNGSIPWHLQGDSTYFLETIQKFGGKILVASKTHQQIGRPIADFTYVWSHRDFPVEKGKIVHDLSGFLSLLEGDLWVIGGASLYKATLDVTDELYITRIDQGYGCDTFYPKDLSDFELSSRSERIVENNTPYCYEVYTRRAISG